MSGWFRFATSRRRIVALAAIGLFFWLGLWAQPHAAVPIAGGLRPVVAQSVTQVAASKKDETPVNPAALANAITYQYVSFVKSCAMCDVIGTVYQGAALLAATLFVAFTVYFYDALVTGFAVFMVFSILRVALAFGDAQRGPAMLRSLFLRSLLLVGILLFFGGGRPETPVVTIWDAQEAQNYPGLRRYLDWIYQPFTATLVELPRIILAAGEMISPNGSFATASMAVSRGDGTGDVDGLDHIPGCNLNAFAILGVAGDSPESYVLRPILTQQSASIDQSSVGVTVNNAAIGGMLCSLARMNRMIAVGFVLGGKMATLDKHNILMESANTILRDGITTGTQEVLQQGGGWLIMGLYGFFTVLIAFYLIDTLVAATLLTVMAPFWLAAPAFPGGGKYFMQALRMALHAMLTVAFVALPVALVAALIAYTPAILSTDSVTFTSFKDLFDAIARRDPALNMSLFDSRFLYMLLIPMIGIGLMGKAAAYASAWAQTQDTGGGFVGAASQHGQQAAAFSGGRFNWKTSKLPSPNSSKSRT
ncbi:hypothetical protein [Roseiterribacter gracilis]|uniref:Uncharacterized protein n=1 Tax=Roseiterribacter gracilis TaxID=2812848 RepID=A0A8S8XEH2_9PROT|nr:hypothetical protein TMPK1_25280 [Rhodospirillales bacterium TMPK1]